MNYKSLQTGLSRVLTYCYDNGRVRLTWCTGLGILCIILLTQMFMMRSRILQLEQDLKQHVISRVQIRDLHEEYKDVDDKFGFESMGEEIEVAKTRLIRSKNKNKKKKPSNSIHLEAHFDPQLSRKQRSDISNTSKGHQVEIEVDGVMMSALGIRHHGVFTQWRETSPKHSKSSLEYSRNTGEVSVKQTGHYFIYTQMWFHIAKGTGCVSIMVDKHRAFHCVQSLKTKADHQPTRQAKYTTCFTGGVQYLRKGAKICIQNECSPGFVTYYNMTNSSFFGMFKVS